MTSEDQTDRVLDQMLANLPRELPPSRDLWHGIDQSMTDSHRKAPLLPWAAVGLAAGFALALVVFWPQLGGRWPTASLASVRDSGVLFSVRARQVNAYRERLPMLDEATRARVERDLAVIQAAEADLAQALSLSPHSAVLSRLYEGAVQQEFDLYDTIVRATEPAITRTST